jgi:hypothetical protein
VVEGCPPLFESVTPLRQPLGGCHPPLQGRIGDVPRLQKI